MNSEVKRTRMFMSNKEIIYINEVKYLFNTSGYLQNLN